MAEKDKGTHRPVMVVIGDGSFQYAIQGLWSASQHQLPIVYIVPRNSEYAILKSFAVLEETPNVPGLDLPGLHITSLAEGYGCVGVKAETEEQIILACKDAFKRNGPTVIEVPIQSTIPSLI